MRSPENLSRRCTRRTAAFLLVCLPTLSAPVARATDDLCGATILADLTLDHDLTCVGNGLIVGADGISLKLNGHTITGSVPPSAAGSGSSSLGARTSRSPAPP